MITMVIHYLLRGDDPPSSLRDLGEVGWGEVRGG